MKDLYIRMSWPDYQLLMEKHGNEWLEETASIGDSDVLLPYAWVLSEEYPDNLVQKQYYEIS